MIMSFFDAKLLIKFQWNHKIMNLKNLVIRCAALKFILYLSGIKSEKQFLKKKSDKIS